MKRLAYAATASAALAWPAPASASASADAAMSHTRCAFGGLRAELRDETGRVGATSGLERGSPSMGSWSGQRQRIPARARPLAQWCRLRSLGATITPRAVATSLGATPCSLSSDGNQLSRMALSGVNAMGAATRR